MSSYTIDALALLGASTVRNVRSYQEKGLLPAPTRRGRSAIYDDRHLARLRTIGALLGRGYSLASISELINFWQTGRDFDDLLGLEEALALPFSEEEPAVMTAEAVAEIWGDATLLEDAIAVGFFEVQADGALRVPSLRLLHAGVALRKAGVDGRALLSELVLLRNDIERLTERFVRLVVPAVLSQLGTPRSEASDTSGVAAVIGTLRPLAKRVVDAELARALEIHVLAFLAETLTGAPGAPAPKVEPPPQ